MPQNLFFPKMNIITVFFILCNISSMPIKLFVLYVDISFLKSVYSLLYNFYLYNMSHILHAPTLRFMSAWMHNPYCSF